jgi:GDPmannose 4,6-dehydratase
MLQQEGPGDYVIGTGESHSVREFVEEAFSYAGMDWNEHICIDPRYFRPAEVDALQADASRARRMLGWTPRVGFRELVRMMVDADVAELQRALAGGTSAVRPAAPEVGHR